MYNEYEMVAAELITPDYEEVGDIDFNTQAYRPSELNSIIFDAYNKKYVFQSSISDADFPNVMLHIFQKETQKIVLFETVTDYEYITTTLALLDSALKYYVQELQQYRPDDILIIPVAEVIRRHFRLLTVTNKAIHYYDSKNSFINKSMSVLTPIVPAAIDALSGMMIEEQTEKTPVDFAHLLSKMGTFMYRTAENYPNSCNFIQKTCSKYFPERPFYEHPLAHQAYNENTDCGPLTAAYAEQAVDGYPDVKENIIEIRARYGGYDTLEQTTTVCRL